MVKSVSKLCIESTIKAVKWFPVLVSLTLFIWSWYAYNIEVVYYCVPNVMLKIVYTIAFHILYILAFWSYIHTIFAPQAKIPFKFYLPPEVSQDFNLAPTEQHRDQILFYVVRKNDLPVSCRTYSGAIRYCEKCNLIKPDRCHHCSVCGVCVLRMDHHCPWINNCVSFTNHKFFVLFLGYTFALCLFVGATTLPYFLTFWNKPLETNASTNTSSTPPEYTNSNFSIPLSARFHILFLFFISFMLMLGVMSLYFYHLHLVLSNRSTLESFRPPLMVYGPDKNAFNLGKKQNMKQIFGPSTLLWFIPIFTTQGSGLFYDQRRQLHPGDEEVRQGLLKPQDNTANNNVIINTDV